MNETDLREQVQRAEEAKALLENELLGEAFVSLRARYEAAWRDSEPGQAQQREELYYAQRAVDHVQQELLILLDNGKVAAERLADIERKRDGADNR